MAKILKLGKVEEVSSEFKREMEEMRRKEWEEKWGAKWEEREDGILLACHQCFTRFKATKDDIHYESYYSSGYDTPYYQSDYAQLMENFYILCPNCREPIYSGIYYDGGDDYRFTAPPHIQNELREKQKRKEETERKYKKKKGFWNRLLG